MASHEARPHASCFADEVGIDFPSVTHAVDRMRRGFTGDEHGASWSGAIHLSPREARDGATVPLEVPLRCTCDQCGGRGETWAEPCGCCAGSGAQMLRHQLHVSVPPGVIDGATFHFTVTPRHSFPTRIELYILVAS